MAGVPNIVHALHRWRPTTLPHDAGCPPREDLDKVYHIGDENQGPERGQLPGIFEALVVFSKVVDLVKVATASAILGKGGRPPSVHA